MSILSHIVKEVLWRGGIAFSFAISLALSDRLLAQVDADPQVSTQATPQGQRGLSPDEARGKLTVSDDLKIETVLHEPEIAQPIFITFDERGRLWVVQYRQYPDPAGLKVVSRDSVWRTVYDKVPPAPPNHIVGRDKITIHEDTDGDGVFDRHKTFIDGLNVATAVAPGKGGVWVLNPPYLLFYPDQNRDDVPDENPIVHLAGFGLEDSHSVANSLCWGPDGWLYGCQGSTVTSSVKRPGFDDKPVQALGQAIWRYHPETKRYEIFAEGGGNAFGLEIDSRGRIFSGHNGGDTRGFHYVQGGYYQKGFDKHGPLSNAFAFGYFPAMKHDAAPRFTHTFAIYEGGNLPVSYCGKLFGVAPLQNHLVLSDVLVDGSSVRTHDLSYPLTSTDSWFRPVDIKAGPEGALYVVDMYEGYISHRDHYQGRIDRDTGRIYRLSAKDAKPDRPNDLSQQSSGELVKMLSHQNKWQRRSALRVLGDRRDLTTVAQLRQLLRECQDQTALEALWATHLLGALDESTALAALKNANPDVRLWTVRLLCDERQISPSLAGSLANLAASEPNVDVRSQLACSARRLSTVDALRIVKPLLRHDEDSNDVHLPLLLWWGIEAKISEDPEAVLGLFQAPEIWQFPLVQKHVTERLMRRFAASGKRSDLLICARLLKMAPGLEDVKLLLAGFETATAGRALSGMPPDLTAALEKFGGDSVIWRLRQGRPAAIAEALKLIDDSTADKSKQLAFVQIFGEVDLPECVPVLLRLLQKTSDGALQSAALSALQRYPDPKISEVTLATYTQMPDDVRRAAHMLLASRQDRTKRLLESVDRGVIDPKSVPIDVVQHMSRYRDEHVNGLIRKHWGEIKPLTTAEAEAEIARAAAAIDSGKGTPKAGKQLFREACAKCHTLFGDGGRVGPDLTSYQRHDLRQMLLSIVHPSAEIREGYSNYIANTDDGRTITGLLVDQDPQTIVVRSNDGKDVSLPREQTEFTTSPLSSMPEGLLKAYTDQQIRDLFAYLRSTQPLVD